MPWEHCERTILDDAACPECGISKGQWTVQFQATRTFRLKKRRPVFRLQVLDGLDRPVAARFRLEVEGADPIEGTLDDFGTAKVPRDEHADAEVVFPDLMRRDLALDLHDEEGGGPDDAGQEAADPEGEARFPCSTQRKLALRLRRTLRLVLRREGAPLADARYALELPDGARLEGTSDGGGRIAVVIPAGVERVVLRAGDPEVAAAIALGPLQPASEVAGAQVRLNNLGHRCGPPDGERGARTEAALRRFQAAEGLEASGELDEATAERLAAAHGY